MKIPARGEGLESALEHSFALLGESGASVGVALAAQTLSSYQRLERAQRKEFFLALLRKFSPEPNAVLAAAKRNAEDGSARHCELPELPARDPGEARVAVFYSIGNCQPGLRGVSLGDFLIKQVVESLSGEFPRLKPFCTLSPIPGFTAWLSPLLKNSARAPAVLAGALAKVAAGLNADVAAFAAEPATALERLDGARAPVTRLCAAYLVGGGGRTPDAAARFHLGNGALPERLNWGANVSRRGMRESLGLMVNCLYDPARIERNRELFNRGRSVASPAVRALLPKGNRHARPARHA